MGGPLAIGYVMTDYPRLAMTFISDEIDEVERLGHRVVPIAMNVPIAAELSAGAALRRQKSCLYLKDGGRWRLASPMARLVRRHPRSFVGLVVLAVRSARLDLTLVVRRLAHVAYAVMVVEHCRERGVRHLHAHFGQSPASIAWFAALIGNWEADEEWSWSFTIHGFQDFVDDKDARLDLKARSADFVICVSDFTRSQLCRVTDPALWDRFHVVRCGIDLDRFPRRCAHTPGQPRRALTVGRLSPEKGQATLIEALRQVRDDTGLDVELDIVGDGPFRSRLEQRADELGLRDSVRFHGQVVPAAVAEYLTGCDVFCLPSFSEGLPVSIMEAMAVGVPVVATAIAGIPELAAHGETALTVPPANVADLAHALALALSDRELCGRLVDNARAAVEERHSLRRNVPELVALFDRSHPAHTVAIERVDTAEAG